MPKNKPLRIIIDTNLWISFIISKSLSRLDSILFSGAVTILLSIELIEEIEATINKPKLKKYFREGALNKMLEAFDPYIDLVSVKSKVAVCRDVKDDFLLSLALDGMADVLITGDKDLLVLENYQGIQILKLSEFLEKSAHI